MEVKIPEEIKGAVALTSEDLERIGQGGYEILEYVNRGMTRAAFRVRERRGHVDRTKIMKLPFLEIDPRDSALAFAAAQRKDRNLAEVLIENQISHPYIAEVHDAFQLSDGRTVIVETDYPGAVDLETALKTMGPIRDKERAEGIFRKGLQALSYLNLEKRIVHRDVKPSNVLLLPNGDIKLTDLQTATKINAFDESQVFTLGGASFNPPENLNTWLSGNDVRFLHGSDAYGWAATFYYLLTGHAPVNYKVIAVSKGLKNLVRDSEDLAEVHMGITHEIIRNTLKTTKPGEPLEAIVKVGRKWATRVDPVEHDFMVRAAIEEVPRQYRKMFYNVLRSGGPKAIRNIKGLQLAFEKTKRGVFGRFADGIAFGARYILPSAVAAGVAGLCIYGGIVQSGKERKPTMADVLRGVDYRNFSLENILEGPDRNYVLDVIVPCMEDARERLPKLEAFDKSRISLGTEHSHVVIRLNKRLVSSWLRACYLSRYQKRLMGEGNDRRLAPSFVPFDFALISGSGIMRTPDVATDLTKIALGAQYLKLCLGPKRNVADVLADYISSKEVINTAIARTESISYFPRIVSEGEHGGRIEVGYRRFLPPAEQEFVDMATALYAITDEDGQVHWDRIPRLNFVPGTYSRLTIPSR